MNTQEETVIFMLADMLRLAHEHGVAPTENTEKVARARVRLGIPLSVCPCAAKDEDRGCISPKCLAEINSEGLCHCRCFRKQHEAGEN